MVLKLYGANQRVGFVLHEKGVPFEIYSVDLSKGEHKTPEHIANHPFGQIPYIDDDGFILYESRAICRYIATKWADQGTQLIPTDLKEYAIFEQGASIETANFDPSAMKVASEVFTSRRNKVEPDQAKINEAVEQLKAKLDAYEVILSKQDYIGGNQFTLADIFHFPYGALLQTVAANILTHEDRPNVKRWWERVSSRPAWILIKDGVVPLNR